MEEDSDETGTLLTAMWHRARCQFAVFPLIGHVPGYFPREYQREQTSLRFHYLLERSRALASDPTIGLVFLHLPVPHPPAIYSRTIGKFTNRGPNNYLDGLALADWTLGQIQQSIDGAGLGARTALIVTADHGWRMLWRGTPDWTPEEEAASRGIDTSGVPFLVKLPGQQSGAVFASPLDNVITGDIALAVLKRQLVRATDILRYLDVRPRPEAPRTSY